MSLAVFFSLYVYRLKSLLLKIADGEFSSLVFY